jgi:hypothetical protein
MCTAASDSDDERSDDDQVQREDVFSTSAMHLVKEEDNVECVGERDEKVAECNEHDLSHDESDTCEITEPEESESDITSDSEDMY